MALTRVEITFGGKPTVAEGANFFDLELGVAPSRGIVTMYASDVESLNLADSGETLKITDGDSNTQEIKNLFVSKVDVIAGNVRERPSDAPDSVVALHLEDIRSKWKWKTITGQFNVLQEDGIAYRSETIKGANPFTFDELLKKVFEALDVDLEATTDLDYLPQNVKWEFASAPAALEALLGEVGWALAWQADDTFSLIDLDDPPQEFDPGGFTIVDRTVEERDVAHDKPETARVAFRIMRKQELIFSPVLQHDGMTGANSDITAVTAKAGEWDDAATVLTAWGTSIGAAQQKYYRWFSGGKSTVQAIKDLGGGPTAIARARRIGDQLFRVFRLKDTNASKILPLLPLTPEIGAATGRELWQGAVPGDTITYHVLSRENRGVNNPPGIPNHDLLVEVVGQPSWPLKIVSQADGIVAFQTPAPLFPPVTGIKKLENANGFLPFDFELVPGTIRIGVGFAKSFSSATDPESDYFIVEQDLGGQGDNNGETKTFLASQAWSLEVFDSTTGDFAATNTDELTSSAEAFLDAYERGFDQPPPERITVAGIHSHSTLDSDVRGIRWDASQGIQTVIALFTVASFNPFSLPPGVRGKQFALAAEQATLWNPSNLSGGGGGSVDVGSLENVSPIIKDHGTPERSSVVMQGWGVDFINSQSFGLLVASDRSLPESKKDPCEGEPQITQSPKGPATTRPVSGTGVQVSGGPADRSNTG